MRRHEIIRVDLATKPPPLTTYRHSVGAKFGGIVALCALVVIALSFTIVSLRLRVQDDIQSEALARETAKHLSKAVQNVFESAVAIVDLTQGSLIALKDDAIRDPQVYDTTLKRMIYSSSEHYGGWLAWDAADQPLDPTSAAARLDPKGGFATYWHQNGMEMIGDKLPAEILASDLYQVPYKTGRSYLLEPHAIDAVAGDPTLVTSFARPLEHDGKIVGVVALDLKLDAIADAIAAIDLPASASISVVTDGGVVVMTTGNGNHGIQRVTEGSTQATLLDMARRGDGSEVGSNPGDGAAMLTSWSAISFSGVKNPWYLLMSVPRHSLLVTTTNDRWFFLGVAAAALATLLAAVMLAMNRLVGLSTLR